MKYGKSELSISKCIVKVIKRKNDLALLKSDNTYINDQKCKKKKKAKMISIKLLSLININFLNSSGYSSFKNEKTLRTDRYTLQYFNSAIRNQGGVQQWNRDAMAKNPLGVMGPLLNFDALPCKYNQYGLWLYPVGFHFSKTVISAVEKERSFKEYFNYIQLHF